VSDAVLEFLGAAGTVTGSRFLIQSEQSQVLVDAGMFQGLKRYRLQNWEPFPIDPSRIDAIVLTHAHIDHSGYLPALAKQGFTGPVYCTKRTMELCTVLLPDAAHLQEEEARYANRKGFSKHKPALPLYTTADANAALELFEPVSFGERQEVAPGVAVTFHVAGHILGSSSAEVEVNGRSGPRRILVSGDLGRGDHPLLQPPAPPPDADIVLLETTYGNRVHPDPEPEIERLCEAIRESASRGGMVLIPAFAVDRTEVVLLLLQDLMLSDRIPRLPIYADSPMALRVLDIYRQANADGDLDLRQLDRPLPFSAGDDVHECRTPDESKSLSELTYPSIIISASGMATGGRVLHHLARLLPDNRNTIILSGFQAAGTRGRLLADGKRTVKLLGQHVPVRATVVAMESLSVHADADDLVSWVGSMSKPPEIVYTVHGEPEGSDAMCERLAAELDLVAVRPHQRERVLIG
jgi:metallo-beta-lactamase family protein